MHAFRGPKRWFEPLSRAPVCAARQFRGYGKCRWHVPTQIGGQKEDLQRSSSPSSRRFAVRLASKIATIPPITEEADMRSSITTARPIGKLMRKFDHQLLFDPDGRRGAARRVMGSRFNVWSGLLAPPSGRLARDHG